MQAVDMDVVEIDLEGTMHMMYDEQLFHGQHVQTLTIVTPLPEFSLPGCGHSLFCGGTLVELFVCRKICVHDLEYRDRTGRCTASPYLTNNDIRHVANQCNIIEQKHNLVLCVCN